MSILLLFTLILGCTCFTGRELSANTHYCKNCINGNYGGNKYCKNKGSLLGSGETCCDPNYAGCETNDSTQCADSQDSVSHYILCPIDANECGTQLYSMTTPDETLLVSKNYISSSSVCWYRFNTSGSAVNRVKFKYSDADGIINIYSEEPDYEYKLEHVLNDEDDPKTISISPSKNIYVIFLPDRSSSEVAFYAEGFYEETDTISTALVLVIIIGVVGLFAIVGLFILIIPLTKCIIHKCKVKEERNQAGFNNMDAIVENPAPTQRVINQTYQHNIIPNDQANVPFPIAEIPPALNNTFGNGYPVEPNQVNIEIPVGIPIRVNGNNVNPPESLQGANPIAPVKANQ